MKKEDLDALASLYDGIYSLAESGEYLSEAPGGPARFWDSNMGKFVTKVTNAAKSAGEYLAPSPQRSAEPSVRAGVRTPSTGFSHVQSMDKVPKPTKSALAGRVSSTNDIASLRREQEQARLNQLAAASRKLPVTTQPATKPPKPGAGAKVVPTAATKPKFTPQTGNKAKDMATWAKANPTLATAAAEKARIRGTQQTDNPLMKDMKSRLPMNSPSVQSSNVAKLANKPTTLSGNQSLVNNPNAFKAATPKPSSTPKKPMTQTQSFEWPSVKTIRDIANAYSSIYEAKKKDQDLDGDTDFADVQIARMIASGMTRAQAIAAVKNKSYNEEYGIKVPAGASDAEALKGLIPKGSKVHEMKKKKPTLQNASYEPEADMVDEATRMRKELGKEGETATRKELAARSRAYKRSGSVDKTIAAAERRADWTDNEKKARTLRKLAASRRGSVRDKPRVQLRGYAAKVEGGDKELQTSRQRAMSAGTLTPKEKQQMGEEFGAWVDALLAEGYDLSDFTWDEMYEIYEETEKEREERLAKRRARVREMESQGRVMTSSRRTSERAKQRREEQRAERLERLANKALADTVGTTRRSSKPMGSEAPEPKEAAPAANRKLAKTTKRDTLASRADDILRMIQNEDFELWLEDLIEEGYELSGWTDGEIIDLYLEIERERYS